MPFASANSVVFSLEYIAFLPLSVLLYKVNIYSFKFQNY